MITVLRQMRAILHLPARPLPVGVETVCTAEKVSNQNELHIISAHGDALRQ